MMRRSSNSYTRPWPVIVRTCFSRVSEMMRRCASASLALDTTRVGPEASVRRISWATPPPGTKSVLRPTAGSPRSWKPHPASVIPVKTEIQAKARASRLNNDVHQAPGHHDDLLRGFALHELLRVRVRQGDGPDLLFGGSGRHLAVAAKLAVHLHHQLDPVLPQRRGVHLRPGLVEKAGSRTQLSPERGADVRNDGREQQHRVLEHLLRDGARRGASVLQVGVEVEELAHGGDRGVELQAPAIVVGDLLDGLVELEAQVLELLREIRRCRARDH